jgi:hypothetical protein
LKVLIKVNKEDIDGLIELKDNNFFVKVNIEKKKVLLYCIKRI